MIYLKKFLNHTLYETYINGGDAVFPNVSICATEDDVHYNSSSTPPTPPTPITRNLICTYVPTPSGGGSGSGSGGGSGSGFGGGSEDLSTILFSSGSNFADSIESMTIDGNEQSSIVDSYDFGDTSEHTVVFTLKDSVTGIDNYAFYDCGNLTSIIMPNSVTSIGSSAFFMCYNLTSITIPNSITSIGSNAFASCGNLTNITCSAATAPTIQNNTFSYVHINGTLTVPTNATGYDVWMSTGSNYLGFYGWTKVEE